MRSPLRRAACRACAARHCLIAADCRICAGVALVVNCRHPSAAAADRPSVISGRVTDAALSADEGTGTGRAEGS